MKILKNLSLCLVFLAVLTVNGNTAHAATRLTPQHLYRWADTNNTTRLHQFKQYINLQDKDKNTALCLAQQAKNKPAYSLLLKFGASTKVSCHDDNDPICAIIAGEKTKVSPAGLLLLGAGAAAGAYLLLDDDDDKKCKVSDYPLDECPEHGTCSTCEDKKRLDKCDEFWTPNADRTECIPVPCPTGEYTTCENKEGYATTATPTDSKSGDAQCYTCSYKCDTTSGNYDTISACETANGEYICTLSANGCYQATTPKACPIDYPSETACTTSADYNTTQDVITYGGRNCYSCAYSCKTGEETCPAGKTCTPVTTPDGKTCYINAACPTGYTETTQAACETANPGYYCTESAPNSGCWKKDQTNPKQCTLPAVTQNTCEAAKTGFVLDEQETGEMNGDKPCVNCVYTCNTAAGYYDAQNTCQTTSGQTCTSVTQGDKTCWLPSGNCPTDSPYTSKTQCETANPGYNCTENVTGSGCWKKDPTNPKQCTLPAVTQNTCEAAKTGFVLDEQETGEMNGDKPCVNCVYTCASGYYDTQSSCQTTSGKTCTGVTQGGKTCWLPSGNCPTDYPYTSKSDCESHSNGYQCVESATGSGCWKPGTSPLTCPTDHPSETACTRDDTKYVTTQDAITYGGRQCYSCAYSCKVGETTCPAGKICSEVTTPDGKTCHQNPQCPADYTYTSKASCEAESNGYQCVESATGSGCWKPGTNPLTCPIDHPSETACTTSADYNTTQDVINYGGRNCYNCAYSCKTGETTCPTGKVCTEVTTPDGTVCHRNPQCPTGYTETTQTACETANPGYYCTESAPNSGCWKKDPTNLKECTSPAVTAGSCETAKTGFLLLETNTGEMSGTTPCVKCQYACNAEAGYYTNYSDCTFDGFTCGSVEQKGLTCYFRNGSSTCPTDHPSETACPRDDTKYVTTEDAITYGGRKCYSCAYSCKTGEETCPTGKTCTSVKTPDGKTCYQNPQCPTDSPYTSQTQCETANPGYNCTENVTGSGCWKKDPTNPKQCTSPAVPQGNCPTAQTGFTLNEYKTGEMNGTTPCVNCIYACNTAAGYYDSESSCKNKTGKNCSSVSQEGKTCWYPTTCPSDYPYTSKSDCESHSNGYQCVESATGSGCWKPGTNPLTCTTGDTSKQKVEDCGSSASNGWNYNFDGYSGGLKCGICTMKNCPANSDTSYSSAANCPKYDNLTASVTGTSNYHGDDRCYQCNYQCNETNAFALSSTCIEGGWTCKTEIQNGITCYIRNGSSTCPTDHPSETACTRDDTKYVTTQDVITYGGRQCYSCAYSCKTGETTCPAGKTCTPVTTPDGKTCYQNPQCPADYTYTSKASCEAASNGYQCVESATGSGCWKPGTNALACTTGDTSKQSVDDCGTQKGNGWTYSFNGYSGGKKCGICTPKTCQNTVRQCDNFEPDDVGYFSCNTVPNGEYAGDTPCYNEYVVCASTAYSSESACTSGGYTCTSLSKESVTCWLRDGCPAGYSEKYASVDNCGSSASNGWDYESIQVTTGKTCGKCTAKACTNNTSSDYYDRDKCPTYNNLNVSVTGTSNYNGDERCYQCNYKCDNMTTFELSSDCTRTFGACKPATISTISGNLTCYVSVTAEYQWGNSNTQNTTHLVLESAGTADVYGLSDDSETLKNTTNSILGETGHIEILHNSTGNAYGMFAGKDNTLVNDTNAQISIKNNAAGTAYGMYTSAGGTAINRGSIQIDGLDGTAYGIYGEGQNTIENTGTIDVSGRNAYGIYVKDGQGSNVLNTGTINVNASNEAHGIYIDQNSASAIVSNKGTITINGETKKGQTGITLNGAKLRNYSMMNFSGKADLNALGGTVYLENGGVYTAQSLSGDLNVGTSTVLGGNQDTYTSAAALQTENVSDLNLASESALFTAETKRSEDGKSYDVVMNRKNFAEFSPNDSISSYLEANYQDGNLEQVYDSLKSETDDMGVKRQTAKKLGYDIMPNFADENFTALKSLNRNIADTILKPTDEENRVVAGYDNINWETDTKGLLSGADLSVNSMYTFGDKRLDNHNRLGLGLSFTKLSSDYDVGGDRDLNIVSIFMPYMHKFSENLRLASVLSVGYGYGEYDRGSDNESDITDIFYGLTNELRYTINLNGFAELEPALMLNAIGYYEDGYDEGNGSEALETRKTHHTSVEAGLGLFLKKEVATNEHGKFGFKIGGAYYRELASPYDDISGRMKNGNNMWYRINDYANLYSKDRAILEAMIDYEYKNLGVYAKYNRLIQKNNPQLFDLGIKYKF